MDLVRDLLDSQLVDRHGRNIGRVDGIVLELREGRAPLVEALEVGPIALARRLHPAAARAVAALARWTSVPLKTTRLPLRLLRDIGVDIQLDLDARAHPVLLAVERWVSAAIVSRIPGGAA